MSEKKLQYQMADGSWENCQYDNIDKTEFMLTRCESANGMTRDEVLAALESGNVDCGTNWYSKCRYAPKPVAAAPRIKEFVPDNEEWGY